LNKSVLDTYNDGLESLELYTNDSKPILLEHVQIYIKDPAIKLTDVSIILSRHSNDPHKILIMDASKIQNIEVADSDEKDISD